MMAYGNLACHDIRKRIDEHCRTRCRISFFVNDLLMFHIDIQTAVLAGQHHSAFLFAELYPVQKPGRCDISEFAQVIHLVELHIVLPSRLERFPYESSEIGRLVRENYTVIDKWAQYKVEYETQTETYKNDRSAYETALGSVSDTKFVLANPFKGEAYGYVLNLLIGFTDEQSADYKEYSAKKGITEEMKIAYREKLLKNLVAKDQRTSWVQNSYGTYDKATKKFTFDSKYLVSDDTALSSFIGKVTVKDEDGYVKENSDGVEETKWQVTDVTSDTIAFDAFYDTYLKTLIGDKKIYEKDNALTIGQTTFTDELNDKFNELMFAFSTDTGCLNKTYGYLSTPSNSDYVKEFANAARAVVTEGVGAYTVVATDYGYHIIICTNVISDPYTIDAAGEAKFKADVLTEDTIAYKYRNVKVNAVVDSEVSKIANKFISEAKGKETTVSYNYGAFKDLVEKDDFNNIKE